MAESIVYENLIQEALLGVVQRVLRDTQENGLKKPHSFYIAFLTTFPGVFLPPDVKKANPENMTIVLQYQFWDLQVTTKGFGVTLSFQGASKKLFVPFDALISFVDPSVKFGLNFTPRPVGAPPSPQLYDCKNGLLPPSEEDALQQNPQGSDAPSLHAPDIVSLDVSSSNSSSSKTSLPQEESTDNVIALDMFRKKDK